jgi:hypothetical protein
MLTQHGIKAWLAYDDRRGGALEHKEGTINKSSNTISCDVLIEEQKVGDTHRRVLTFILTIIFDSSMFSTGAGLIGLILFPHVSKFTLQEKMAVQQPAGYTKQTKVHK